LCLIFALKEVFLEERKRESSPLFSLSLSLMKKKAQTQNNNNKKAHTTKEDF